jgi:hypothetical protein
MLNDFKIRKYWILTFCMILCSISSTYSQDIPDNFLGINVEQLTKEYKALGFPDQLIEMEINRRREAEKKYFLENSIKELSPLENQNSTLNNKSVVSSKTSTAAVSSPSAAIAADLLNPVVEENLKVKKGVTAKFFIEPSSPEMTYKWIFYELDNVTQRDSATTAVAYQKYNLPGTYKVMVDVTEANGCSSTFIKTVEVLDYGYCVRNPINFAFEATSTNLKYTWTATNAKNVVVNEVLNNTDGFYTYTPTLAGDYTIKLTATGVGKCETVFQEKVNVFVCEPDPICTNHIVIVVDESGSIDATEARKIRAQLKSFIAAQIVSNEKKEGEMYVSLIGLSDTDINNRTDHLLERLVTKSDLEIGGSFYNWIENYGRRYGKSGISEGSDYWKSGLNIALTYNFEIKPKLVFLITDGCQTTNPADLKLMMEKFDNYQNSSDKSKNKPHLYVVGMNNGFYVDNETTSKITDRNQDPNFVSSLLPTVSNSKNSANLPKSLQYLFNYQNNAFPIERINGFDSATYFAHTDFTKLADEPFYLSDGIVEAEMGCGGLSEKDYCANCLTFMPEINKEYLLSAWVKEETNIQVKEYENSEINIVFYNDPQALDPDPNDPNAPSQIVGMITLKPSGAIIDGWQRISGKFIVPKDAVTAGIVLNNKNVGIPVYFDDLRIHPMDGSVKTFVYDSETFKLMSELDENNYSTFYEYDNEGGLVRVKKETTNGIKTIQETRSGNYIKTKQ